MDVLIVVMLAEHNAAYGDRYLKMPVTCSATSIYGIGHMDGCAISVRREHY